MDKRRPAWPNCNPKRLCATDTTVAAIWLIGSRFHREARHRWPQSQTDPPFPPGPMAWPAFSLPRYRRLQRLHEWLFRPQARAHDSWWRLVM